MRRLASVLLPLSFVIVAACSSASSTPPRSVPVRGASGIAATSFTPWWTYHHSPDRAGHVSHPAGSPLKPAWRKNLGNAVYGEPLVVGSTLIAATEGDRVFGLNARTGKVRWKKSLGRPQPLSGLPCGNIDPLGITGTPAYDAKTGSVFVVAETRGGHHTLWALNAVDRQEAVARVSGRAPDAQPQGRAGALRGAGRARPRGRLLRRPGRRLRQLRRLRHVDLRHRPGPDLPLRGPDRARGGDVGAAGPGRSDATATCTSPAATAPSSTAGSTSPTP